MPANNPTQYPMEDRLLRPKGNKATPTAFPVPTGPSTNLAYGGSSGREVPPFNPVAPGPMPNLPPSAPGTPPPPNGPPSLPDYPGGPSLPDYSGGPSYPENSPGHPGAGLPQPAPVPPPTLTTAPVLNPYGTLPPPFPVAPQVPPVVPPWAPPAQGTYNPPFPPWLMSFLPRLLNASMPMSQPNMNIPRPRG